MGEPVNIRMVIASIFVFFDMVANPFGYIGYEYGFSLNIGDDIQAVAAKRFLPEGSIPIIRERVAQFSYQEKVKTLMSGWFMYRLPLPSTSWPPSSDIDPLLISMHFDPDCFSYVFTEEGVAYLKKYGSVGARDLSTLRELQKRGIPSYFSGCLTLTLENSHTTREGIIYAVDLSRECVEWIRKHTKHRVEEIYHGYYTILPGMNISDRLALAERFLEKYATATCVVTSRLHACLPCLAFKTPVLLVREGLDRRFEGLEHLMRRCTPSELLKNRVDFDFNNPPENPSFYLSIRNDLINRVTSWVRKNLVKS